MRLRPVLTFASALLLIAGLFPVSANGATVWRFNLYRSAGFLYQDPYYTACTAAAVMMMLNFTDLADTGGTGFRWTTYRTKNSANRADIRDMTSILYWERGHDTLAIGRPGSDAHRLAERPELLRLGPGGRDRRDAAGLRRRADTARSTER